jgi:hypothetical protein
MTSHRERCETGSIELLYSGRVEPEVIVGGVDEVQQHIGRVRVERSTYLKASIGGMHVEHASTFPEPRR